MIKDSLKAAGITRIVWIDDKFATPNREDMIEVILATLVKLKAAGHANAPGFTLDLSASETTIKEVAEAFLEDKNQTEVRKLLDGIKDIAGEVPEQAPQDDLSSEEFQKLKQAFGNLLVTQSLQQWTSSGAEQFAKASEDTLFLVDKEFTRESAVFDGSTLVADLVKSGSAFCILLTHRCSNSEDELKQRNEICEKGEVYFHKFAVLSKRTGDPQEAISKRFARALSSVLMHRFTGDLAFDIAETSQDLRQSRRLEIVSRPRRRI